MRELLATTKALADESRLRILASLQGRELCLCQLVELLGLAASTVSRHASILEQARLVVGLILIGLPWPCQTARFRRQSW
jgi:ArsR family transcriptional regulator, arsenate/arsenite/antimonite-responsive transcriptional repressor